MFLLLLLLAAAAQKSDHSNDRLPYANPLPITADDTGTGAVLATASALVSARNAGDGKAILAQVRPDGNYTVVSIGSAARDIGSAPDVISRSSWSDVAKSFRPGAVQAIEQLTDPAVEMDGDIAMVWSPYETRLGTALQTCGTDHFDLVRENGRWEVLNLTVIARSCFKVRP